MLFIAVVWRGICMRLFKFKMISLLYSTSLPCCVKKMMHPASVNLQMARKLFIIPGVYVQSWLCQIDYDG